MKILSFFSKFTIICNIAFLIFVILNKVETKKTALVAGSTNGILNFLKTIIITLGYPAIIINLIMCLTYAIIMIIGKRRLVPKWLAIINVVFLICQFYFFFF